jgi:hypothetical protein
MKFRNTYLRLLINLTKKKQRRKMGLMFLFLINHLTDQVIFIFVNGIVIKDIVVLSHIGLLAHLKMDHGNI